MSDNACKRWCFTYNIHDRDDAEMIFNAFGLGQADGPQGEWYRNRDRFEYIRFQEEEAPTTGQHHLQGWLILKTKQRLSWLHAHFLQGAHYEVARGTDEQCEDYCTKKDSKVEGGLEFVYGELPQKQTGKGMKMAELRDMAVDWLDKVKKEGYIPPKDIPSCLLAMPGFITGYKLLTAACCGPNRDGLKILTLIGPPGSGKSYAVAKHFPNAGRWLDGNSGNWFLNPMADTMVFEEFDGSKIGIQAMKKFLDPYPYAFEVKGYTYPVMATRVIITSNVPPSLWYKDLTNVRDAGSAADKRALNINAIYDRIGYSSGGYVPSRTCGTYVEAPLGVNPKDLWDFFDQAVREWMAEPMPLSRQDAVSDLNEHFGESLDDFVDDEDVHDDIDDATSH